MKSAHPFLGPALLVSCFLHAAVIVAGAQLAAPAPRAGQAELTVRLHDRVVEPVPAPPLTLPPVLAESTPNATAAAPVVLSRQRRDAARPEIAAALPQSVPPQRLSGEAARRAAEQLARDLPYPPEAIERGLQGEALVLLFLDASGDAVAARLESSSGHAVLDEAAVRAARRLRSLPDSAPREALLPVRFRLR
ncbi:MAG TPA: TonB family protein [Burkholderiales bacterium]